MTLLLQTPSLVSLDGPAAINDPQYTLHDRSPDNCTTIMHFYPVYSLLLLSNHPTFTRFLLHVSPEELLLASLPFYSFAPLDRFIILLFNIVFL